MISKCSSKVIIIVAVFATVITAALVAYAKFSDGRGPFSRTLRSIKGEYYVEQKANDLADDIQRIPTLERLQPWALEIMAQFQTSKLRGEHGSHLYWATNVFTLAPEETPQFIKTQWGETN